MNLAFFCINQLYTEPAKVAIASFRRTNPRERVIVFHAGDIDADLLNQELGVFSVEFQLIKPHDFTWHNSFVFSKEAISGAMLRLAAIDYIGSNMPDVKRALYLDSDTVTVGSIGGIWGAPLDESYVAAALDYPALPDLEFIYKLHPDWDRRMDINANYFNSGVMLLNMSKITDKFKGELELGFKKRYDGTWRQDDQDYLNMVFSEDANTIIMPRTFNAMPEIQMFRHMSSSMLIQQRDVNKSAYIYHFAGALKPWSAPRVIPDERACTTRYDVYYFIASKLQGFGVKLSPDFVAAVRTNAELTAFIGKLLRDQAE